MLSRTLAVSIYLFSTATLAQELSDPVEQEQSVQVKRRSAYTLSGKAFHEQLTQDDLAAIYSAHLGEFLPANKEDGFFSRNLVFLVKYEFSDGRTLELTSTGLARLTSRDSKEWKFFQGPRLRTDIIYREPVESLVITRDGRIVALTATKPDRQNSLKISAFELQDDRLEELFVIEDVEENVEGARVYGPISMAALQWENENLVIMVDTGTFHGDPSTIVLEATVKGDVIRKTQKALRIEPESVQIIDVNGVKYFKIFGPTNYNGSDVDRREDYQVQVLDINFLPVSISDLGWNFGGGRVFHRTDGTSYAYIYKNGFSGYKWFRIELDGTTQKVDSAQVPVEYRREIVDLR